MKIVFILKLFTLFQLLFFSLYLFHIGKRGGHRTHRHLICFLLLSFVWYLSNLIPRLYPDFPDALLLGLAGFFLFLGPALLKYANEILGLSTDQPLIFDAHALSYLIFLMTLLGAVTGVWRLPDLTVIVAVKYIHLTVYGIVIYFRLRQGTILFKQHYASRRTVQLSWLKTLLISFLIVYALFLFHFISHLFSDVPFIPPLIPVSLFFILVTALSYYGLIQPDIHLQSRDTDGKYLKSKLDPELMTEYQRHLTTVMEERQLYLEPDLNVRRVSEESGIPSHYISQVLNLAVKQNFYSYINGLRIEFAKNRICESEEPVRIADLIYESGFNSKSAFHNAFKRVTGMSPKDFQKK